MHSTSRTSRKYYEMSLKRLETKWKTNLTCILEELSEAQFRKLLFNLAKIPQGVKDGKVREEIPQMILQHYGTEGSIAVMEKEMKQMPRMDAAVQDLLRPFVDKLKEQRKKSKGATGKRATDSGSVAKKQDPAAAATSKRATDSGSVAKKQEPAADRQRSYQRAEADPVGPAKLQQKTADLPPKPTGSTKVSQADPVGPAKLQQKTADLSPKPTGSTKVSQVQSAAVHTGKMKIVGIKDVNKKYTHLEAEFNDERRTFFVTSRLLADACGFRLDGGFRETLLGQTPLSVEVKVQGNKITDIKKM